MRGFDKYVADADGYKRLRDGASRLGLSAPLRLTGFSSPMTRGGRDVDFCLAALRAMAFRQQRVESFE